MADRHDNEARIAALKTRYPGAETFRFGDGPALCEDLTALVRQGRKRATCSILAELEAGIEAMPEVGRRDIVLDWEGRPQLVVETLSLTKLRFCDVTEEQALAEGENETLADWQDAHRAYFERNGCFDPNMWLVYETFRVVEDLAADPRDQGALDTPEQPAR